MVFGFASKETGLVATGLMAKLRRVFRNRELFVHDGASMRRVHLSTRLQLAGAGIAAFAACGAVTTVGQFAVGAVGLTRSASHFAASSSSISKMEAKVASLQADLAAVKKSAHDHAARLEARQAGLAALINGHATDETLLGMVPGLPKSGNDAANDVALAFSALDEQQIEMASKLQAAADEHFSKTAALVRKLGVGNVVEGAMGGPYEPVAADSPVAQSPTSVGPAVTATAKPDPQFRALFDSWKRLDTLQTSMISIPSQKPVDQVSLTSGYGVRSDPFRGGRAMHAGVDIPGPIGTPIYATADAIVGRAGWVAGYGNMVELEHGKGIQTRYGHMSAILVGAGSRIKRGQQIGLMGSTGRSTGSHLHYEVRLDGKAVNPIPFLRTADYLLAMQKRMGTADAMGGPVEGGSSK